LFSWKKLDKLQAAVYDRFGIAVSVDDGFFGGSDSSRTPVDLSAVGDNAHGLIVTGLADQSGAPITLALVVMWQGRALDLAGSR
jgi:hypothetical protein